MEDITNSFGTYFDPISALVFYRGNRGYNETYVECFDMETVYQSIRIPLP